MNHYAVLADLLGVSLERLQEALDPLDSDYELGRLDSMERMARALEHLGIQRKPIEIRELCIAEKEAALKPWQPYPEVLSMFSSLRQRQLRLGLCSNANPIGRTIAGSFNLDLVVDPNAAVFSCEVGMVKPDPMIYSEVSRRLNLPPRLCLYVDDNGRYLEAAQGSGMVSVAVLHADGQAALEPNHPGVLGADFQVEEVAQVADLFAIPAS